MEITKTLAENRHRKFCLVGLLDENFRGQVRRPQEADERFEERVFCDCKII